MTDCRYGIVAIFLVGSISAGCNTEIAEKASRPVVPEPSKAIPQTAGDAPMASEVTREQAIATIERLGGMFTEDAKKPGSITSINLSDRPAQDKDLEAISALNSVEELNLTGCGQLTPDGLTYLMRLDRLKRLILFNAGVTDQGVEQLPGGSRLEVLSLDNCPSVTDKGLEHVGTMLNLRDLNLTRTGITDAGLASLKPMAELRVLALNDTKVTDAGLEQLRDLPNLENLGLVQTQVTDAGVKKLQEALPRLKVQRQ